MKSHDDQISNYIESRITRLETVIENVNQSLKEIKEGQIRLENKISDADRKIDRLVYWMLGSILLPAGSASFIYILKSLHHIT